MTPEELRKRREIYARQQVGYDRLREERKRELRTCVTADLMPAFDVAFQYSLTLPFRMESGYTQFHQALAVLAARGKT